ncbi:hypothetical protein AAC387_Pa01g2417 [Persea americana]
MGCRPGELDVDLPGRHPAVSPVDIMAVMSTKSTGTRCQVSRGLAGFSLYPVDIMAVMLTGYTGLCKSEKIQVSVISCKFMCARSTETGSG